MPVEIQHIVLDGVPTIKLTRGGFLVGYLQAGGWVGAPPSINDLADIDLGDLT